MSIEDARRVMADNKGVWERLARQIGSRAQIYQWRCYFRYAMLTILTQSNRASYQFFAYEDQQTTEKQWSDVNLEKVWMQDREIERHIFESIRSFTTFTLDK